MLATNHCAGFTQSSQSHIYAESDEQEIHDDMKSWSDTLTNLRAVRSIPICESTGPKELFSNVQSNCKQRSPPKPFHLPTSLLFRSGCKESVPNCRMRVKPTEWTKHSNDLLANSMPSASTLLNPTSVSASKPALSGDPQKPLDPLTGMLLLFECPAMFVLAHQYLNQHLFEWEPLSSYGVQTSPCEVS